MWGCVRGMIRIALAGAGFAVGWKPGLRACGRQDWEATALSMTDFGIASAESAVPSTLC